MYVVVAIAASWLKPVPFIVVLLASLAAIGFAYHRVVIVGVARGTSPARAIATWMLCQALAIAGIAGAFAGYAQWAG